MIYGDKPIPEDNWLHLWVTSCPCGHNFKYTQEEIHGRSAVYDDPTVICPYGGRVLNHLASHQIK